MQITHNAITQLSLYASIHMCLIHYTGRWVSGAEHNSKLGQLIIWRRTRDSSLIQVNLSPTFATHSQKIQDVKQIIMLNKDFIYKFNNINSRFQ